MEYSYKFRLYPNLEQTRQIECTFDCCRYVFNHFLAQRIESYEETGKTPSCFDQMRELPQMKKEEPWLASADSTALQQTLKALDAAYKNFFRRVKTGEGKPGFPKFKSKYHSRQSYKTTKAKVLDEKHVQLPKLGAVRCVISKQVEGRILSATVSREPSGKYFVALCCYTDVNIPLLPPTGSEVDVEIGIKDLAVVSDGTKYANNKHYYKAQKKLARLQRQLSRKKKGSKNREKAKLKVARLHEQIANQRNDSIHKMTSDLISKHDTICLPDLKVKDMLQNREIAKAVADASFGEIRRQLEYKAAWYGRTIRIADVENS